MAAPLRYPETLYDPSPFVDLARREERERLSGSALKAFFKLVQRWQVRDEEARALLGGISNGTFYKWKGASPPALDADVLTRISYLIGIFKALQILHSEALADEWVRLPNGNRMFGGRAPLAFVVQGGLPAMQAVRRLLDARRGGL